MSSGALVSTVPGGAWAWAGVRAGPAPTIRATGGYADRPEAERLAWIRSVERAWLDELWAPGGVRFEVRYVNDPGSGLISCSLLAGVYAAGPGEAAAGALAWRERLGRPPGHVVAVPLDGDELRARLDPEFRRPAVLEIRKRLVWGWTTRPDAAFPAGSAVFPLGDDGGSWAPVWTELAAAGRRALVSVCLEPGPVRPGLLTALDELRREHARLATDTDTGPVYSVRVPADPFSVSAVPLLEDALRRYGRTGRAYRIRITVAAEDRPPTVLAGLLAAAVSPHDPWSRAPVLTPAGPEEPATAWRNVTGLGQAQLGRTYAQGAPPGVLHPAVRELAGLVDPDEAATVFRLPCETPRRPPLFERVAAPRPAAAPPPPQAPDPHQPTFHDP